MKNIIAQSLEKLYQEFEKADQMFLDSGMKDMDAYEKGLAEAARRAAAEHMESLYCQLDQMLCEDVSRAEKYTVQRHDTRELLTVNGTVRFNHTLFRSRGDGSCHYLLDEWLGLAAHERMSCNAEATVLSEATRSSYARTAKILGKDAEITKTAVMEKVHAVQEEIPFEKPEKKRAAE